MQLMLSLHFSSHNFEICHSQTYLFFISMARTNRITQGCRVKGSHGEFVPNPRGFNRRIRSVIYGRVLESVGNNKWNVKFDNGGWIKSCGSRSLQVVREDEGLPANEAPTTATDASSEDAVFHEYESEEDDDNNLPNGDWDLADEFLEMLNQSESDRHTTAYESAWNEIKKLSGEEVVITSDRIRTVWTVVDATDAHDEGLQEVSFAGLLDESLSSDANVAKLFLKLWPGDIYFQLENLNRILVYINTARKKALQRPIKSVSMKELLTFIGLVIAATSSPDRGYNLWKPPPKVINKTQSYGRYMKEYRFKEIKSVFPCLFWNKENENDDPWWKFRDAVKSFNLTRKEVIKVGTDLCLDESMSAMIPRTR